MADMITANFSVHEMACKCGCGNHNQMVSTTGINGPHTQARAADILVSGERAMRLFEKARQIGFSGIGLSQKGDRAHRFVHIDTLGRKALWSY